MSISELESSQDLTLRDIHSALVARALRKQQVAQTVMWAKLWGMGPAEVRDAQEKYGIDQDWWVRAEALIALAQTAVEEEGHLLDGRRKIEEMPIGRVLRKMQDILVERVRHAEQILMLRASGWRRMDEIRAKMGVSSEEFARAERWLRDAGLELRED